MGSSISGTTMRLFATVLCLAVGGWARPAAADDWPMWRYDAGRTATASGELPNQLKLKWEKQLEPRQQVWDDPLNHDLMPYDRVFEPIVYGGRVYVGFNDSDKVVCWDLESGKALWRYYTDGPVRLPPAAAEGRVFVASDDGVLHALDADSGSVDWKLRGGPDERKVLGNGRLISMWPARGGPVCPDGHVYFAASIWPFMGTFLYGRSGLGRADLGQRSGPRPATSSNRTARRRSQASRRRAPWPPPKTRSSSPAADRSQRSLTPTGELSHFLIAAGGKGNGGSFAMGSGRDYYVHTRGRGVRRFDLESGVKTALMLTEPVIDGEFLITSDDERVWSIKSNAEGTEQSVVWNCPSTGETT